MLPLFDDQSEPEEATPAPAMMSESQRSEIRSLFATLGVTTARDQFDYVAEMTGQRIASVADLDASAAGVLISRLRGRVANLGQRSTGNSWDDRTEDTWIDRL